MSLFTAMQTSHLENYSQPLYKTQVHVHVVCV